MPLKAVNSGIIFSRRVVSSINFKPTEGFSLNIILLNSTIILSIETILMRSASCLMASREFFSISKCKTDANLIALIILKGSSEYVCAGSKGVRRILFCISSLPLKGSISSPKFSAFREIARAFTVKSLRFWSSSKVPVSTAGFLESSL